MSVKGKNLIVEAMYEAGFSMDLVNDKEIPEFVIYEIKQAGDSGGAYQGVLSAYPVGRLLKYGGKGRRP